MQKNLITKYETIRDDPNSNSSSHSTPNEATTSSTSTATQTERVSLQKIVRWLPLLDTFITKITHFSLAYTTIIHGHHGVWLRTGKVIFLMILVFMTTKNLVLGYRNLRNFYWSLHGYLLTFTNLPRPLNIFRGSRQAVSRCWRRVYCLVFQRSLNSGLRLLWKFQNLILFRF